MKNNPANHQSVKFAVFGVLALWFLFALFMSLSGRYAGGPDKPPLLLGLTVGLPILFFAAAYLRRGSLRAFAHTLDLGRLTQLNVIRIIGLWFIADYALGRLPAGFALPAGIGDVTTALAAVPLALALSHRTPGVRKWFIVWNIFGLADLLIAVSSGILYSESSIGFLAGGGPSTRLVSQFPLSLIPTFFVPLLILLHLLALARRNEVPGGTGATAQPT